MTTTIKAVAYIDNEIKQAIINEWYAVAALHNQQTATSDCW